MAYAFSASAAGVAGSDTVTVSGAGFTVGHYVTLWLRVNGTGNSMSATPSGFTLITTVSEALANIGQPQQLFAYGGQYVSGNFAFTVAGANGTTPTLIAVSHSGRVSTAPTNFQSTVTNGSASPVSEPFTGITAAANDDIIWCGCIAAGTAAGTWVTTAPASYTSRQEVSQNGAVGYAGTSAVCTSDAVSAGATGTLTGSATNAGNSGDRYGLVLALSAAAGGGGGATQGLIRMPGPGLASPFTPLQFSTFPFSTYVTPAAQVNPVVGSLGRLPLPGPGIGPSRRFQFVSPRLRNPPPAIVPTQSSSSSPYCGGFGFSFLHPGGRVN